MNGWIILGFAGQIIFSLRFFVQWICSEQRKESYIPVVFWYLSLMGAAILFTYALYRKDPVFMVGQATGLVIYIRNLALIYQKGSRERKGEKK